MRKKVLITGVNSGIGLQSALQLARAGYDVLVLCRTSDKVAATCQAVQAANPQIVCEGYAADLGDLAAVRAAAVSIAAQHPRIDVLLNNAGYFPDAISYTGEVENSLLASHLGHFLLTTLLLPALQASGEGRIINVSSAIHASGKVDRMFRKVEGLSPMQAYGDAKLANILFTLGLDKRLPASVTAYALHPGVVRTNFDSRIKGPARILIALIKPFFVGADKGAETSVYLASAPIDALRPYRGRYFVSKKPAATRSADLTSAHADQLWERSAIYVQAYLDAQQGGRPVR